MLELTREELVNAIKGAESQIAFEDTENQKQYFRGMKQVFETLLKRIDQ